MNMATIIILAALVAASLALAFGRVDRLGYDEAGLTGAARRGR